MEQQAPPPWLNLEYIFGKIFDFMENFVPWMFGIFDRIFGTDVGFLKYVALAVIFLGLAGVIFVIAKIIEIKYRKKVYFSDFF